MFSVWMTSLNLKGNNRQVYQKTSIGSLGNVKVTYEDLLDDVWMTEFFEERNFSYGSAGHTFCFPG